MITNEQIELIAKSYGIGVSYREPGNGGFVLDESGVVYKSITDDIRDIFRFSKKDCKLKSEYLMDEALSFAA